MTTEIYIEQFLYLASKNILFISSIGRRDKRILADFDIGFTNLYWILLSIHLFNTRMNKLFELCMIKCDVFHFVFENITFWCHKWHDSKWYIRIILFQLTTVYNLKFYIIFSDKKYIKMKCNYINLKNKWCETNIRHIWSITWIFDWV